MVAYCCLTSLTCLFFLGVTIKCVPPVTIWAFYCLPIRVGINSGMDYWNGTLDWTTGLSYYPFLDKFLCYFKRTLTFSGYKF